MSSEQGFGIWITGLPASGKSSVASELALRLRDRGVPVVVLESDALRKVLTPEPSYSEEERDCFYGMLVGIGELIARSGVPVIFDATANRRAYRDRARSRIPRFIEVFIDCPLEVCKKRDPKGIYARAASGAPGTVPGTQAPYEPPLRPEVVMDCRSTPSQGAELVLRRIRELGLLPL
ncbi:MAG TPA: adenylyl-sulfate kinase [Nitrospirota bacterium]|nr:adenylyl-sulfate kinase [Nitrospirota bacterium]